MKTGVLFFAMILMEIFQYPLFAQCSQNDWAVYFGGSNYEYVEEIAADPGGNAIITGRTRSTNGIATEGSYQSLYGGGAADAFVAKFDSTGSLLWSTYFGGPGSDYAYGISIDLNGNIYIGGRTTSTTGIATSGAYQTVFGGGNDDGFIAKFSPDGLLLWSTYFGGKNGEWIIALANDISGNLYATGFSGSATGIATAGAYQTVYGGGMDCTFIKFDSEGNRLFSTYFGAGGEDRPHDIQVDFEGNIILLVTTPGGTGMSTTGVFQEEPSDRLEVSISKWTPDGQLIWASYLGGTGDDRARECYTDAEGNIYLTGFTNSSTGIATTGSHQPDIYPPSGSLASFDSYLVKFDTNGQRIWGTYFGGSKDEYGRGLRLTPRNTVIISGVTSSTTNICSEYAFQSVKRGASDAYLAEFSTDGSFLGGTYFGGTQSEPYDMGYGPTIDLDPQGNVYMTLSSNSSDIPNALNAFHPGSSTTMFDAVVTRFPVPEGRFSTILFIPGNVMEMPGKAMETSGKEMEFNLYPNPATSSTTLNIHSGIQMNTTLVLSDLSGKSVLSFPLNISEGENEIGLDVSNVASGTYLLSLPEIPPGADFKKLIIAR